MQTGLNFVNQVGSTFADTQHAAQGKHHVENLLHAALIEDHYIETLFDQIVGDIRLQVGKAEYQIGFQGEYLVRFG